MNKYCLLFLMISVGLLGKTRVVVTFDVLGEMAKVLGGDYCEVYTLVPSGSDLHSYRLSSSDLVELSRADLVFAIGLGLEYWLDSDKAISVTEGIDLLSIPKHDKHVHSGEYDPHIWLDPMSMVQVVETMRKAFSGTIPKSVLEENSKKLQERLLELDAALQKAFELIPVSERKMIPYHDSFRYFAKRYDIQIPATILGSLSTDTQDLSAKHFKGLIEIIKKNKIRAVFCEHNHNCKLVEQLTHEAKLPLPKTLFVTTDIDSPNCKNYFDLMIFNTRQIISRLNPQ